MVFTNVLCKDKYVFVTMLGYWLLALCSCSEIQENESLNIPFVKVQKGNFVMGADLDPKYITAGEDEGWRSIFIQDEFPVREIDISYDFEISKFEITNLQYELFAPEHRAMRGSFKGISEEDNEAIVYVSWEDANEYAKWLSEQDNNYTYRMPTEAEWEYVARSGTRTPYSNGNASTIYENNPFSQDEQEAKNYQWPYPYTWSNGCRRWTTWKTDDCIGVEDVYPSDEEIKDVDLYVESGEPNSFGVYGMHGGVEEWVSDWYGLYDPESVVDPAGPQRGTFKVTRGGSHNDHIQHARSANRMSAAINDQHYLIGIRLVRTPKEQLIKHNTNEEEVRPWQENVLQSVFTWGNDSSEPIFELISLYELVPKLDDGSHYGSNAQLEQFGFDPESKSALLTGPLYTHNHSPTIVWCPNGDMLISWFSGESEVGPELTLLASRGKRQSDGTLKWTYPSEFLKAADRNMHSSNIIISSSKATQSGVLHQMASIGTTGRWDKMAMGYRKSIDNGATWSPVRMILELDHGHTKGMTMQGNMFETQKGDLVFVADDEGDSVSATGSLVVSSDGGESWHRRGHSSSTPGEKRIAGLHAAVAEIADQNDDGNPDLLAIGRDKGEYYDGMAPISLSIDGGSTWSRKASIFPSIKGEQRFGLLRLQYAATDSKPLLFVGFANEEFEAKNSEADPDKVKGLFVALSWDEGKTWPEEHRRVISNINGANSKQIGVAPWQKINTLTKNQGQEIGYMSIIQSPDGLIYLTDGKMVYTFNLSWILE